METLAARETAFSQTQHTETIRWKQLWSLAALYSSIIIGWIAYQNYQPRLLVQFNFTGFTFLLMVVQGVILVVTPMIAGRLGDRYRFEKGHRLPIISSGISFAAMIFMAVAFTLIGNPGEIFRWILPVLIVFWLVAMSIFTSPALSTIELFTPVDKLPRAMAVLTIVGNLVYSLEPVIVDIIDYVGAPVTFIAGGVAVFFSGYALKKNSLGLFKLTGDRESPSSESEIVKSPYVFIFFLGLSVGVATTLLFYLFPELLGDKMGALLNASGNTIIAGLLFLSALLSWPVSYVVNKYGMLRIFWLSLTFLVLSSFGVYFASSALIVGFFALTFATTFTSLSIASLPLAINRAAFSEKVFCVGMFFSGVALPEGVWEALQAWTPPG
jgi:MFS family permease